jgi:hypothetical protein
MKLSNCRFCHESIFWAKTAKGKNMAMDPEPSSDGKFVVDDIDTRDPQAKRMNRSMLDSYDGPLYECHWDTCSERKGNKDGDSPGY